MVVFDTKIAHKTKSGSLTTDHSIERNMLAGVGLYLQFRFSNNADYYINKDQFLIENSWTSGQPMGPICSPHYTAANIYKYQYQSGHQTDIFSFLVRKSKSDYPVNVLHASLYRKWSNYSFLVSHVPKGKMNSSEVYELKNSCRKERIGLIIFNDADNIDSFSLLSDSEKTNPSPRSMDEFINAQFSSESKAKLLEWLQ